MSPTMLTPTTLPPSTTIWPCTTSPKLTTIRSPLKLKCRATSSSSSSSPSSPSSISDFDLYDLLGIDRSSDKSQIKAAYRTLQKRCHPDIAGDPGHDMAIILNEAYKHYTSDERLIFENWHYSLKDCRCTVQVDPMRELRTVNIRRILAADQRNDALSLRRRRLRRRL